MKNNKKTSNESYSAIWTGNFSEVIDEAINFSKQSQINGFDLTIKEIAKIQGKGVIDFDNSKRFIPEHKPLSFTADNYWDLEEGSYIIRYNEIVSVPKTAVGIIQPRSSLLRMGGTIIGAWWDSGYSGRGQGLLVVTHPLRIFQNARIAQIVFIKTHKVTKGYEGQYQNEGK
ncbi:MAG: deoxyuridine 5'-triphosphate nucleotidohydrolase [Asgard group archaeon]|nr:deoxyuridine 5'-triphosphate nucleotidohydrolase [Asgard group archaeon]